MLGVPKNFAKFTAKHLHRILFFDKVADLISTVRVRVRVRLYHKCFPENFAKALRTPFLQSPPLAASGRLLLVFYRYLSKENLKC